ncbi:hypothetical protein ANCCAN_17085 [Ancylostoma caninum]|uniref:Oxidoreductase, FAD/FMN-binding protein n=1 Tax=Ancylostoma caninum TaxID=29170 RepID=A0A368G244_ANCCA|nr:hypothetical protein ANCCAN_17085 [Ancylostoma caninum]
MNYVSFSESFASIGYLLPFQWNLESAGNVVFSKENDGPELREACKKWSTAMKQDGALAIAQISHAGRQTPEVVHAHPFSCSDIQLKAKRRFMGFGKPIALSLEQIKTEVIDRFVFAAKFARDHEDAKQMCRMMERCGFDFVELSGGNFEKPAFQHMRESTRKREAFFLDFAEQVCAYSIHKCSGKILHYLTISVQIRPVFEKAIIYLTGGFRTAPAMVNAICDGITDGIGLGRPITAEPDLPAKILRGECLSAADTKLDPDDYMLTATASNMQMGQMGKRPFAELKDVCDDIADLSNPKEAENYKKASEQYYKEMKQTADRGEAIHGVLEYENIVS